MLRECRTCGLWHEEPEDPITIAGANNQAYRTKYFYCCQDHAKFGAIHNSYPTDKLQAKFNKLDRQRRLYDSFILAAPK